RHRALVPSHGLRVRHRVDPLSRHPRFDGARRPRRPHARAHDGMSAITPFSPVFRRHAWSLPLVHALLVLASITFVFPMLWMISTSLKPIDEVMKAPPDWIPETIAWQNYADMARYIPFARYAMNTFFVATMASLGTVASSALVAYSFTRLEWPGQKVFFGLTLATMMVPFRVLM